MFRGQIVKHAYECVASREVRDLLTRMSTECSAGLKILDALRFVARPILDCRKLWYIARIYPQFRQARILHVPPQSNTNLNLKHQIDIFEAWARLNSSAPSESEVKKIAEFGEHFRQDCNASYSLHAEMQLFMHHDGNPSLTPSLCYYGCSKKACLLCEGFLQSLPSPIVTRARHGRCYPAWGVPSSRSIDAQSALKSLEKLLVSRIKNVINTSRQGRKTQFIQPVRQSTCVSSFSTLTMEEMLRTESKTKFAREAENRRKDRLIL